METENWLWYYEQVHLTSLSSCDPSPPSGSAQLQLLWGWRVGSGESFQKYHLHTCVCPEGHVTACGTLSSLLISLSNFEWMCKWLYLCVYMSVRVCACSCVCRCLPLLNSILIFEKEFLAGPGTHQLGKSSLLPSKLPAQLPSFRITGVHHPTELLHGWWISEFKSSCLFGKSPQPVDEDWAFVSRSPRPE